MICDVYSYHYYTFAHEKFKEFLHKFKINNLNFINYRVLHMYCNCMPMDFKIPGNEGVGRNRVGRGVGFKHIHVG